MAAAGAFALRTVLRALRAFFAAGFFADFFATLRTVLRAFFAAGFFAAFFVLRTVLRTDFFADLRTDFFAAFLTFLAIFISSFLLVLDLGWLELFSFLQGCFLQEFGLRMVSASHRAHFSASALFIMYKKRVAALRALKTKGRSGIGYR